MMAALPENPALQQHAVASQSCWCETAAQRAAFSGRRVTVVRPSHGWLSIDLRELWEYRDLIYFLVWRDIKVRYKQTALGAAWAVLQPLLTMVVFSLFFGRLSRVPSDGVPYPLFSLAALVPWSFFSYGLSQSANSLVGSQNLIKKVYFPRLAIPLGTVLSGLVDFGLGLLVLLAMMLAYGITPGWRALWTLPLLLLTLLTALGVGFWLSALNVQYRDVRFIVPFLIQLWLFATPIAYPSSLLHEPWRTVYAINPLVGVLEGFRWALLRTDTAPGGMLVVSSLATLLIFLGGAMYFRRMESTFADLV